jgi:hypothetical protein
MSYFYINREECIGDSLNKINANADNFDLRIDSISSTFVQSITSISPQIVSSTNSGITTLSAVPFYKALVTFRGKNINPLSACTIYSSYNVTEVTKLREAYYRVKFTQPIPITGFTHSCVIEQDTDATTVFGTNNFDTQGSDALEWTGLASVTAVDVFSVNVGLPPTFTSYKDVARATLVFY